MWPTSPVLVSHADGLGFDNDLLSYVPDLKGSVNRRLASDLEIDAREHEFLEALRRG